MVEEEEGKRVSVMFGLLLFMVFQVVINNANTDLSEYFLEMKN